MARRSAACYAQVVEAAPAAVKPLVASAPAIARAAHAGVASLLNLIRLLVSSLLGGHPWKAAWYALVMVSVIWLPCRSLAVARSETSESAGALNEAA